MVIDLGPGVKSGGQCTASQFVDKMVFIIFASDSVYICFEMVFMFGTLYSPVSILCSNLFQLLQAKYEHILAGPRWRGIEA